MGEAIRRRPEEVNIEFSRFSSDDELYRQLDDDFENSTRLSLHVVGNGKGAEPHNIDDDDDDDDNDDGIQSRRAPSANSGDLLTSVWRS